MIEYKFKEPKNAIEQFERLYLVEDRGDRVLVESSYTECCGTIMPQFVYSKDELIEV